MAVLLKGLALAWGTILVIHLLSHHYDHLDPERLTYLYLVLTVFFSGIAAGSDDVPKWIVGIGLWFGATAFLYAIRWQVDRDFEEEQELA